MNCYKIVESNIEYDIIEYIYGNKYWYKEGKLHRENGPAVEYANGDKLYYYNDELINVSSDKEFIKYMKLKVFW